MYVLVSSVYTCGMVGEGARARRVLRPRSLPARVPTSDRRCQMSLFSSLRVLTIYLLHGDVQLHYPADPRGLELRCWARISSGSGGLGVRQGLVSGWWEAQDRGRHPGPRSFLAGPRD